MDCTYIPAHVRVLMLEASLLLHITTLILATAGLIMIILYKWSERKKG